MALTFEDLEPSGDSDADQRYAMLLRFMEEEIWPLLARCQQQLERL